MQDLGVVGADLIITQRFWYYREYYVYTTVEYLIAELVLKFTIVGKDLGIVWSVLWALWQYLYYFFVWIQLVSSFVATNFPTKFVVYLLAREVKVYNILCDYGKLLKTKKYNNSFSNGGQEIK